jgi:hypothetical protein
MKLKRFIKGGQSYDDFTKTAVSENYELGYDTGKTRVDKM